MTTDTIRNPWGDDPDFLYLAVDRKKMMEEQGPFDAKTACWVPDHKEGYLKANITVTKGDDVTVITEKLEASEYGVNRVNAVCWRHSRLR